MDISFPQLIVFALVAGIAAGAAVAALFARRPGKETRKLIADKIGNVKFMQYVKDNNYKVEIKHQYKNIDVLLKINNSYSKFKQVLRINQIL